MENEANKGSDKPLLVVRGTRAGSLGAFVLLLLVLYGLFSRSFADVLRYGGLVSAGLSFSVLVGTGLAWVRDKRGKPTRSQLGQFLILLAAVPLLGGPLYFGLFAALSDILRWLLSQKLASAQLGAFAIAGFAFVAGLLLFWLRLRLRLVYGLSEVIVGLAIAAWRGYGQTTTGLPSSPEFYFAILTASIYLVVRGLDNMHQGLQSGSDPTFNAAKRFLTAPDMTLTISRSK